MHTVLIRGAEVFDGSGGPPVRADVAVGGDRIAAVAQVVLMNQVFGPIVQQLGLSASAWVAVLLVSSQLDWFGPFPNADMVGQMGLARSKDLRRMLYNGWVIMAANLVLFLILLKILI